MDDLQRARQDFIKIMERQNAQWKLIDNLLTEDEDTPAKPYIVRQKRIKKKAKIENGSKVH
jgi:hypothetical protein